MSDIVSKSGNLMLSVPRQRGGQPDSDEIKTLQEIGAWLQVNGEALYATRPWKIRGEGPSTAVAGKSQFDSQRDPSDRSFTVEDNCFTQSKGGRTLEAIVLVFPTDGMVAVKSLAAGSDSWSGRIGGARLFGGGTLKITRDKNGWHVTPPEKVDGKTAFMLTICS